MKTFLIATALCTSVCALLPAQAPNPAAPAPTKAIAVLFPTEGNSARGMVVFKKVGEGLEVEGEISGLSPGKHGFHVHEFGDLSSAIGSSAGGHFNPTGAKHGGPEAEERHVGDLGNIEAGSNGTAKFRFMNKGMALEGATSVIGRSVVVHAKADDFTSQPSGDAGERVALGVIGIARAN